MREKIYFYFQKLHHRITEPERISFQSKEEVGDHVTFGEVRSIVRLPEQKIFSDTVEESDIL